MPVCVIVSSNRGSRKALPVPVASLRSFSAHASTPVSILYLFGARKQLRIHPRMAATAMNAIAL
jgi:hypothetical protein